MRPREHQISAVADHPRGGEQQVCECERVDEREEEDDELKRSQGSPPRTRLSQREGRQRERQGLLCPLQSQCSISSLSSPAHSSAMASLINSPREGTAFTS